MANERHCEALDEIRHTEESCGLLASAQNRGGEGDGSSLQSRDNVYNLSPTMAMSRAVSSTISTDHTFRQGAFAC
jgi:hypothetical protein